ncbi:MAG: metal-dependent hydrolase [Pseudomonadales bacterium]|nr:metal-dependent hydrolase [Pseudomonadales bacterium]
MGIQVKPRQMDFNFPKHIPKYWFNDNPYMTHLMNALSAVFPEGERFFIDSVRHYRDDVKNKSLIEQMRGFIGQEAHHSKHHQLFNDLVEKQGTPMSAVNSFVKKGLTQARQNLPQEHQLAITIALEHFTAIMAHRALVDDSLYEGVLPEFGDLIRWHAIEETEHKAVAYDVYQQVCGDNGLRRAVMVRTSIMFIAHIVGFQLYFLIKDGLPIRPLKFLQYLNFLFGTKGFFRKIIPDYLDYYKADFHPWQHDNQALVEDWKNRYPEVSEHLLTLT